jgi:G:T-mismatch repair DNA endonuclease (very short patch repair protein)
MNGKIWRQEELDLLKRLYENDGLCCSEISNIINRPYYGIRKQIEKQKLLHTTEQEHLIRQRIHMGNKNPMFGKEGANKGLTKENCKRIKIAGEKISLTKIQLYKDNKIEKLFGDKNPMFGKISWNNGLTKETNDIILKYSLEDSKRKKDFWNNLPENEKEKRRKQWAMAGLKCIKKNTSIEIKLSELLDKNNIRFHSNYPIDKYLVDFYIDKYNLVIECFGDYWHANPIKYKNKILTEAQIKNLDRDKRKEKYLKDNNINYIFLWETDIHKNINYVKETIFNEIRKIGAI